MFIISSHLSHQVNRGVFDPESTKDRAKCIPVNSSDLSSTLLNSLFTDRAQELKKSPDYSY